MCEHLVDFANLAGIAGVEKIARLRINAVPPVEFRIGGGEQLPFPDDRFDTVLTFLLLCSVENPEATLKGNSSRARPGWQLPADGAWPRARRQRVERQRRINPFNKMVFGGCNPIRPIRQTVTTSGVTVQKSRVLPGLLRRSESRPPGGRFILRECAATTGQLPPPLVL
jgi:hypothetical protein